MYLIIVIINITVAIAHVAPWIEHTPANQRVTGSIPIQGIYPGCRPGPGTGHVRDNHTLMLLSLSLSLFLFPFPSL